MSTDDAVRAIQEVMYPITMDEQLFYKLLLCHAVFGTVYVVAWIVNDRIESRRRR